MAGGGAALLHAEPALDGAEILTVAGALADPAVTAVLAGSGEPPGGDERPLIPDLVTIIAAVRPIDHESVHQLTLQRSRTGVTGPSIVSVDQRRVCTAC